MIRYMAFIFCLLTSTLTLVFLSHLSPSSGRLPSAANYPLGGASSDVALRYQYLLFPKVHHIQFAGVRSTVALTSRYVEEHIESHSLASEIYDSLVDFANPLTIEVMPIIRENCGSLIERYRPHAAGLSRALEGYWKPGGAQNCNEIIVQIIDQVKDQHLEFNSRQRELGRVLITNDAGSALAEIILWRDDKDRVTNAQVRPLDPELDIGSGFSALPLDWPRLKNHRESIKAASELKVPKDSFVIRSLQALGQLPWSCGAQMLGVEYGDSWGRRSTSQWCYGDSFPKVIENDHYFAFRLEE